MNEHEHEHMSKRAAVARLLGLSCSRHINERDVTAIQVATRALIKRIFDRERNWKRRHAAEATAPEETPPFNGEGGAE